MSIYNTTQPLQREQLLTKAKFLADKGCIVELKERKPQRTSNQNRYLHLLLGYFGCQVGESRDYVKTYYYKLECNKELFTVKAYDKVLQRETVRLRSSSSLSTDEMALSITRFRDWASAVAGIYLPSADDFTAMAEIEREIERNKEFI